jgi:hypothetical protein
MKGVGAAFGVRRGVHEVAHEEFSQVSGAGTRHGPALDGGDDWQVERCCSQAGGKSEGVRGCPDAKVGHALGGVSGWPVWLFVLSLADGTL